MVNYSTTFPPAHSSTYVKATSNDGVNYPYLGTDPAKSLTGSYNNNSWCAYGTTQKKFNIDLGSAKRIRRVRLDNMHDNGSWFRDWGIKDCVLYGTDSSTAFNNVTYSDTTDLVLLASFSAVAHIASNVADPQYFEFDNTVEYRYYVLRIVDNCGGSQIGFRRLELAEDLDWRPPKYIGIVDQLYNLRLPYFLVLCAQQYIIADIHLLSVVDQKYSLRLLAQLLQEYGDAPTFRRLCHQYYGSANLLRRLCRQDYGDYLRLRAIADELWAYPAALRQVAEQRYSIAGERLAALMAEGYDISDKALLRAMIDQVYVLPPGEGIEQQPAIAVRADGVTLASVYHLSIEMDESQAWLVGEIHLADQEEFLLCHHLQTMVEISLDATTYVFLVDTPRESDPELARTEYYVSLVSPVIRLDAASARPITRTFDGMMASSIAAEMAALGAVPITWQLVDWYIPPDTLYANNEPPLSIIRRLCEAVGGILQSLPDGTLLCRPEYPLDTTAWEGATPEYYLSDGDNFFSVDPAPEPRAGYNRFLIADKETASGVAMSMTPIDISASVKEIRISRVPWDGAAVGLGTSGGWWVSIVEEGVAEEEVEDLVEIVSGEGRTTRPVYGVVSSDYQEADLGIFEVTEEGLVSTAIPENTLLRLVYTTRFYRFVAADARIEEVQFYPEVRS